MGKILFGTEGTRLTLNSQSDRQPKTGLSTDRELLKKRSAKYVELFSSVDTKAQTGVQGWKTLMDAVQDEFGTADLASLPLGIVGKCFLGDKYEVHILDLTGSQIIKHFKKGEAMPPDFEKARTLALHNAYAFIEVYTDKLVLIRPDGSTAKL